MAKSHYDRWQETFRPVKNHLDPNAAGEGCLFETYGEELDHVLEIANTEPCRVWTLVDGDNGKQYICSGYHLVNRLGYFITEVALNEDNPRHARYRDRAVLY